MGTSAPTPQMTPVQPEAPPACPQAPSNLSTGPDPQGTPKSPHSGSHSGGGDWGRGQASPGGPWPCFPPAAALPLPAATPNPPERCRSTHLSGDRAGHPLPALALPPCAEATSGLGRELLGIPLGRGHPARLSPRPAHKGLQSCRSSPAPPPLPQRNPKPPIFVFSFLLLGRFPAIKCFPGALQRKSGRPIPSTC